MVPMAVAIADVDESRLGEIVKVSGKVRRAVVSEGSVFLTIWDGSNEIKAIVWQSVARGTEVYELRPGDRIAVTGQVAVYRGELEIVASKVEVEQ
ncbi:MAG: OB-fold nucleic acid binding domain-containing protein [Candidatus Aenigmatarchaeota archaeon]